eukprot:5002243-Pyramimonas_sp.AAC.1
MRNRKRTSRHILWMRGGLQGENELLGATPMEDLYTAPTQMTTDNSALATVAEEQRGRLPTRGHPRDVDTAATYYVPLCSTDEDMSKVVLSEQQHAVFDFDRVATLRAYATAAAKRAAVITEDDLLTKADIQANP